MNKPEQISDGLLTLLVGFLAGCFCSLVWVAIAKAIGWL
jgi:hypothetical protein